MSARDYTLLSKLGFADKDKKDGRHDMGVSYLSIHDNLMKIMNEFYIPIQTGYRDEDGKFCSACVQKITDITSADFRVEVAYKFCRLS
jgi:hypothetical protein